MEYIKLLKFNLLINLERRIADKNQVEANQYLIEDTEHEKWLPSTQLGTFITKQMA
ncbi:MAG: hypothetical protein CMIDDMOC_00650 [Sodalis sp. Fle]|nr:MAG: hypothetical protein CMIDDMOC_00650 [Sodalis sp. Fle]